MIRSLRGRLYLGLSLVILLAAAVGAMIAYTWAFDEAIEIQDSVLMQVASLAQSGSVGSAPVHGIEESSDIRIIELGTAPRGAVEHRHLFSLQDGLHVAAYDGERLRLLLRTRSDGSRYAVAQPTAIRDETARDMALRALTPFAVLFPCLLVVTALVITGSMRPVIRLAAELDRRQADNLLPMPLEGAPGELHPFIISINGLLGRTSRMMEQQRRFIADAAHELRTPIAALSLQADNLDTIALPEPARQRVTALKQGMRRTKHLLEQLLALAQHDVTGAGLADMPVVALDGVAKEVVGRLMPLAAERSIDLGFEIIESVSVRGEPMMLTMIIRNLLDNALRYTPRGGRVDISIYREDDMAVLQIEDSGPGIAPDEIARIFDPFVRGSCVEVEDGTGLGLAIVKRIIDALGGTVTLKTMQGSDHSGLRATIRLRSA
jgi:two-component system, OmpR family, sensor kinase